MPDENKVMPADGQDHTVDTGWVVLGEIPARVTIIFSRADDLRRVSYRATAPEGWLRISHKNDPEVRLDLLSFHPGPALQKARSVGDGQFASAGSGGVAQNIRAGGNVNAPIKMGSKRAQTGHQPTIVIDIVMPQSMRLDREAFDALGLGEIIYR